MSEANRKLNVRVAEIALNMSKTEANYIYSLNEPRFNYSTDHNAAFDVLDEICKQESVWYFEIDMVSIRMFSIEDEPKEFTIVRLN